MRFQAETGIPFDNGEPRNWCLGTEVYDIVWSLEGQFVRRAMTGVEITKEFQTEYEALLEEFGHLAPSFAHRLAFNQLMDEHWEEIKREAGGSYTDDVFDDRIGR